MGGRGWSILYGCISTAKSGSSHPEPPPYLSTTKNEHFQSQVSVALSFHAPPPPSDSLAHGWPFSTAVGAVQSHIPQALSNTTHDQPVQTLARHKKQKSRPSHSGRSEDVWARGIITRIINDADRFSQTLSLCWYWLMMIYDGRPLMYRQRFITALQAARLTNSDY